VVQELIAPPYAGTYPNGDPFKPDKEAAAFFSAMGARGFHYKLSAEDTGPGEKNHLNSTATEWFVAFYKPDRVRIAPDLPTRFIAVDLTHNPDYERVPQAFGFRTPHGHLDFVLISVHLKPNADTASRARRKHELAAIAAWVKAHDAAEKDFIILGDMNLENMTELRSATPKGFVSLNDRCMATNTNPKSPKPYDHVMYRPEFTSEEIDEQFGFRVVNLVEAVRPFWDPHNGPFPGGPPYQHDRFRQRYSDHDPVVFRLVASADDD
jgi:hypothetical protein